ncbi:MAG: hypothetical protein LBQ89_02085 [Treponema sp.]|nr:hypothetical protein [Treponema sp.]
MKNTTGINDYETPRRVIAVSAPFLLTLILAFLSSLSPLYAADTQRPPIDVNLIIDGSSAFQSVKEEVTVWVYERLDRILAEGDRVTVWSAGPAAGIVYSGSINSDADKEALKRSIGGLSASGETADFSGALREAAARQSSSFSYTLLISATSAFSSVMASPQSNILRFSRVEEFSTWRALVVGLNLDARVRRAASAFFGS